MGANIPIAPALRAALLAVTVCAGAAADQTGFVARLPRPTVSDAPASGPVPAGVEGGFVNFSFDQVDVATFVKLVGDITGRKFVLGDGVAGKVTVVSPVVRRADVYPLFVTILESVGCSTIEEGGICRVVAIQPRQTPMAPVVSGGATGAVEGVITRVIRLEHVPAAQLQRVLESRVLGGKSGAVAAIEDTNHLIVTDTAAVLRRVERIVEEVDKPGLARMTEVVPLRFAEATVLADALNAAMDEGQTRGQRLAGRLPTAVGASEARSGGRGAMVVPAPHSNSLILVGTAAQIEELKRLVAQMDVDAPSGRGRLNAIFLKYLSAREAATNINALLTKSLDKTNPNASQQNRIYIEANDANNALLVDASPGDFEVVKRLVDQLDQVPPQVHISVLIAELTKDNTFDFAIELAAVDMPAQKGDTAMQGGSRLTDSQNGVMNAIQTGIFPKGLTFGLAYGSRVDDSGKIVTTYPGIVNLNALKTDARFQVLSETALEAQNNKDASVNIVNQIPILKSTIQGGSGTSRDVIQNIDRVDVGIKLKLTPHVIPGGDVRMDLNPSIEAVLGSTGDALTPTIARREVATTVTVPDGKTIVIAGLTRTDKTEIKRKVPILGSIPLLGWLFRNESEGSKKTDLLIFVTPHVLGGAVSSDRVREEWEKKTGLPPHEEPSK